MSLASRGFAAVDMESAGVAEAAAQAAVPFVVIKAVCDPSSRAVPALALQMLDARGRLCLRAVFDAARAGPRAWRELRVLRADFAAALASLRRAASALPAAAEESAS
jgi:adenosylhomocysteine nucleosidase